MLRDSHLPLALPATALMLALFLFPLLGIFSESLTDGDGNLTLSNYAKVFSNRLFWSVLWATLEISFSACLFALFLGYPIAYFLAKCSARWRSILLIFILVPFWTSILVKSFGFIIILGTSGVINSFLGTYGFGPYTMIFNRIAVVIGMSHFLLPFMIFPILSNLLGQPEAVKRAAAIFGAGRLRIFLKVTLPLSYPGIIAGVFLSFVLSLGFYVVPAILGGTSDAMMSNIIDFYVRTILDWKSASVISIILLALSAVFVSILGRLRGGDFLIGGGHG